MQMPALACHLLISSMRTLGREDFGCVEDGAGAVRERIVFRVVLALGPHAVM